MKMAINGTKNTKKIIIFFDVDSGRKRYVFDPHKVTCVNNKYNI